MDSDINLNFFKKPGVAGMNPANIKCSQSTLEAIEKMGKIGSKFTIKTPERRQWHWIGHFLKNKEWKKLEG